VLNDPLTTNLHDLTGMLSLTPAFRAGRLQKKHYPWSDLTNKKTTTPEINRHNIK